MNKKIKILYLLLSFLMIISLSACSLNENDNSEDEQNLNNTEATWISLYSRCYEKEFFAKTFEDLNKEIMSQNSFVNDELSFYYNKKFLDKYNFTTTPNIENKDEFYYIGEKLDEFTYKRYFYTNISLPLQLPLTYPYEYDFKLSTPKDVLDKLNNDEYILASGSSDECYKELINKFYVANPVLNDLEFTYGLTYKARTIGRSLFYGDEYLKYYALKYGHTLDSELCPNYMFPSIEDEVSKEFAYYKPVVKYSNFEMIRLFGRIYIDNYAIDCMIFMRNSYNIKTMDELLDLLEKCNFNNPAYEGVYGDELLIEQGLKDYTAKYIFNQKEEKVKLDGRRYYERFVKSSMLDENGELKTFEHGISFFGIAQFDENRNIINDPTYILDYEEIYEEYFNTFIEGLTEIKINYVNHNK
ncbi:MAG: hypothetical protein IJ966_06735 [Bacilli bacterium]|nr:hypothetical protein [Bacilli bacterium]